jgi:hypothetical protein
MAASRTAAQLADARARAAEVQAFAESMREHLLAAQTSGGDFDRKIADMFNRQGLRTRRKAVWTKSAVKFLRARLGMTLAIDRAEDRQ